jgi:N-methylhydantoinase A
VTDADVVLGRIDPGSFFGNRLILDQQAALDALKKKIAEPLGIDVTEAARSIVDIVDARMADLIRALTVERGHDPRNFVLFAYGGAGPTHVGAYASQIGVRSVVIPLYASVQSAFGIATADLRRHYSQAQPMREPFDQKRIDSTFEELEFKIRSDWIRAGIDPEDASYLRSVDMRFRHQVHEIRVGMGRGDDPAGAIRRFVELYEQAFGAGTAIRKAETEIVTFHLVSSAPAARMVFPKARIDRSRRRVASITSMITE